MAQKTYAYIYDESNAVLISESRQAVENTGVVTRAFLTDVDPGELDSIIQEMWATRFYIDNPAIDRRESDMSSDTTFKLVGRWRVAALRKHRADEKPGIYEELRLGWLQPPGTPGDYPKSKDANDWSGIDASARVVKVVEYNKANRAQNGRNQKYTLVIPGVATSNIKEFCYQMAQRPAMANPIFGLQTKLSGMYAWGGIRNEDQGDGSSTVIATLAYGDGFTPGSIMMNDNWNETLTHKFYLDLPVFPTNVPLMNVKAVDDPTNWRNQISPATIYRIEGASFSYEEGLWEITVVQQTAKPSIVEVFINDVDGAYAKILFFNQTLTWLQNYTTTVLSGAFRNSMRPPQRNEFDLYSGHIEIRPKQNTGEFVNTTGTDTFIDEVHDRLGNVYNITVSAQFSWSKDSIWGDLMSARAAYDLLNPVSYHQGNVKVISFFFPRGKGHYEFKAYTKITRTATQVTNLYSTSPVQVYP